MLSELNSIEKSRNFSVLVIMMFTALVVGADIKIITNCLSPEPVSSYSIFLNWTRIWIELTISGILMGLIYFLLSAGMTIVFGLMGVFNLAHGAFIAISTFVFIHIIYKINSITRITETKMVSPLPGVIPAAEKVMIVAEGWFYNGDPYSTLFLIALGFIISAAVVAVIAFIYEKHLVRLVYGNTNLQMLITLGGAVILIELLMTTYGARTPGLRKPPLLFGQYQFMEFWSGGIGILYSRVFGGIIGVVVFLLSYLVLFKSKIGIIIRAGVESREMIEIQGYNIKRLFVFVFVFANIIAAIGGGVFALNSVSMSTDVSNELLLIVIAAIMIGGVGSIKGCLIGGVLISLAHNYMSAIYTPLSGDFSVVIVMLIVLIWHPKGLNPLTSNNELQL